MFYEVPEFSCPLIQRGAFCQSPAPARFCFFACFISLKASSSPPCLSVRPYHPCSYILVRMSSLGLTSSPHPHTFFFFLFHRNPQPTHSHIRRYTKNTILILVPSLESPPCRSPGLCLVSLSSLPTHAYPLNSAPAAAPALLCLSFIHCLSLVRLLCCAVFLAREVVFMYFLFLWLFWVFVFMLTYCTVDFVIIIFLVFFMFR